MRSVVEEGNRINAVSCRGDGEVRAVCAGWTWCDVLLMQSTAGQSGQAITSADTFMWQLMQRHAIVYVIEPACSGLPIRHQ